LGREQGGRQGGGSGDWNWKFKGGRRERVVRKGGVVSSIDQISI